jgi:hypothetical protein
MVLAAIALGTIWKAASIWQDKLLTLDERLAALGNSFGAGTFALAIVASALALLAYWISLQRPRLIPKVSSDEFENGVVLVGAGRPQPNGERAIVRLGGYLRHGASLALNIAMENTSDWSARNVAVKVSFIGIRGVPLPPEWTIAGRDLVTGEITAVNWEGGADLAIHGRWPRNLPPIFLNEAFIEAPGTDCAVEIEAVAEGFRKSWRFPIRWTPEYELDYKAYGAIEGYCGFPSSHVPEMHIWAVPTPARGTLKYLIGIPPGPPGKRRWYIIDKVAPGQYHVLARPTLDPKLTGAYTVGADSGNFDGFDAHVLAAVPVVAGQLTIGVNIFDWSSDKFPLEPEVG